MQLESLRYDVREVWTTMWRNGLAARWENRKGPVLV